MAIAVDATSQGEIASGTSLTVAHTCTGSNRALYVAVTAFFSPPPTVTATYAGVAMTQKASTLFGSGDAERITLLELVAPATGANNIVVTASGTAEIVLAALSLTGVDQTTPSGVGTTVATDGVTSTSLVKVSETDDLVLDAVAWYNQTITVGAGQTQQVLNNNGASMDSIAISTEPGAASVTMSWSWAASENPGQCAININQAAADGASITPTAGAAVLAGVAPTRVVGTVLTPVTP